MKKIIENGKINGGIQNCSISQYGVEIVFNNNDLADKFALALNSFDIPYIKDGNKVTVSCIN